MTAIIAKSLFKLEFFTGQELLARRTRRRLESSIRASIATFPAMKVNEVVCK